MGTMGRGSNRLNEFSPVFATWHLRESRAADATGFSVHCGASRIHRGRKQHMGSRHQYPPQLLSRDLASRQ